MFIIYFLSFLSFGFYCALKAQKKKLFPKEFLYIASVTFSLVISYLLFYIYSFSYRLGHYLALCFLIAGLVGLLLSVQEVRHDKQAWKTTKTFFMTPLLIIFGILLIYTHFFYSCYGQPAVIDQWGEIQNPAFCQISALPIDNALPYIYGQNVLTNHARELVIDWSIADRPPLQIGAVLPILDFEQHAQVYVRYAEYNLFSTFLQLSWVGVVWGVLNILLKKRRHIWGLIVGFSAVGFFYLNSIFVWPKLLAASLTVFGIVMLLNTNIKAKRLFEYRYLVMSVLAITLGLLAHGGVVFTLLAVAPVMLYDLLRHTPRTKINWKNVAAAAAVVLLLLLPWQHVKSQLTSHDRLVKWQLAGVVPADDPRGTLQTIKQQYAKLTLHEWLGDKKVNAFTLYDGGVVSTCKLRPNNVLDKCNMATWRNRTFFSTFFAFEFFIFGFLIVIWQLMRNSLDKFDKTLLWIGLLTMAGWIVLMYLPGSTVVHQGSYATMLLLFILFGKKLATLPQPAFFTLISLQVLLFYFAWLVPFGIHII